LREVQKRNVAELHNSATCQTILWRHFISATSYSKWLARLFLSETCMKIWKLICLYNSFDPPYIMNIRPSLLTISHKLIHPLLILLSLHTVSTNKYAWIRSLFHLLFWRAGQWKSSWICGLVTSCSDMQDYVEIGFLQWFLPIIVQYQKQFAFTEVTWQQTSKHINKSIICENVSMYRSEFIAVSCEKGSGRKVLTFLFQALWVVSLFHLVKGDFSQWNFS